MITVLLTAVGSASAAAMIENFHKIGCRVVGCDLYPQSWNASSMMLDAFTQIVPASEGETYLSRLWDFARREAADVLFPLTDVECDLLCDQGERFAPCRIAALSAPVHRLCRDKARMAELLNKKGIARTIPGFSPYERLPEADEFPLMLKPVSGRSSQGQIIARSLADVKAALLQRDDYLAQPYLSGSVFTAELARDRNGKTVTAVREELLRTGNGLGTTVRLHPGHELEAVCARIAEAAGIVGCVNMEFIHHEDAYYFLEVNPRFSGGVGFLVAAGWDWAKAALACQSEETLPDFPPLKSAVLTREIRPIITE